MPLACAAPSGWDVEWDGRVPFIDDARMHQLVFGILRVLLSPVDLIKLYTVDRGDPVLRHGRPSECLLSVRMGMPRLIEATGKNRCGRRTNSRGDALRRQNALAALVLPEWVCGTRLKFQTDRWYVAPPELTESEVEALEKRKEELKKSSGNVDRVKEQLRQAHTPTFTAVSRLLCFVMHEHPSRSGDFGGVSVSDVLAVHHRCTGCSKSRARCLNSKHICWGLDTDNAYHRVIHGVLADSDSDQDEYRQPPKKRRPHDWISPSKRKQPHFKFVRLRDRLKETGSRRLLFRGEEAGA